MVPNTLRSLLPPPGPFSLFNREERNLVATLSAALLDMQNLQRFADQLEWDGLGDPERAEVFVEWTYPRDLWSLHRDPGARRRAILALLQPSEAAHLHHCSVAEFNRFFGVAGQYSKTHIQYPGRWSLLRYAHQIADHEEFRRTCIFKWAFNVKPDLVIHGSGDNLLCVEAKWESGVGMYPSLNTERAEFRRRDLLPVSQTEVQQYLVEDILGFHGCFSYLSRFGAGQPGGHKQVTWKDVFSALDLSDMPPFIRTRIEVLTAPDALPLGDVSVP